MYVAICMYVYAMKVPGRSFTISGSHQIFVFLKCMATLHNNDSKPYIATSWDFHWHVCIYMLIYTLYSYMNCMHIPVPGTTQ